jgi:hypothetical protein
MEKSKSLILDVMLEEISAFEAMYRGEESLTS